MGVQEATESVSPLCQVPLQLVVVVVEQVMALEEALVVEQALDLVVALEEAIWTSTCLSMRKQRCRT